MMMKENQFIHSLTEPFESKASSISKHTFSASCTSVLVSNVCEWMVPRVVQNNPR